MKDDQFHILEEIERIAGRDAANTVARECGGRRIGLPAASRLAPSHPLAMALGFETAFRILDEIVPASGGLAPVTVPLAAWSNAERRRSETMALLLDGKTAREVAAAIGCHIRTVYRVSGYLKATGRLPRKADPHARAGAMRRPSPALDKGTA